MSNLSTEALVRADAFSLVAPAQAPALEPTPAVPASSKAPLKRCCSAWRRAIKDWEDKKPSIWVGPWPADEGGTAYCDVMPALAGYDGIRDFLACAAQGILIGAIPPEKGGQLIYAAQVALNIYHSDPRQLKSPSK